MTTSKRKNIMKKLSIATQVNNEYLHEQDESFKEHVKTTIAHQIGEDLMKAGLIKFNEEKTFFCGDLVITGHVEVLEEKDGHYRDVVLALSKAQLEMDAKQKLLDKQRETIRRQANEITDIRREKDRAFEQGQKSGFESAINKAQDKLRGMRQVEPADERIGKCPPRPQQRRRPSRF
jgi:hypothetical protein